MGRQLGDLSGVYWGRELRNQVRCKMKMRRNVQMYLSSPFLNLFKIHFKDPTFPFRPKVKSSLLKIRLVLIDKIFQ